MKSGPLLLWSEKFLVTPTVVWHKFYHTAQRSRRVKLIIGDIPWCNECMNGGLFQYINRLHICYIYNMQSDSTNLINLLCQPQTTNKRLLPTHTEDSSFIIEELKLINTNLAILLKNQKVILQHQKLQIDLENPKIGTTRKFQKKAYYTLASFIGILMILVFIGIIIAIHGHHLRLKN